MTAVARIKADAVPSAEFRGKARDVRRQLITWRERYDTVMAEIATDAQKAYAGRTTTIPLRLLESTKVRWRALGRDACLFQSIELTGRHLRIQDVRFVASGAVHAPDPRMPHLEEHDTQAFCAMEFRLELKKREPRLASRVMFGCALDAIARWFQSAFEPSVDRLFSEMAALAKISPSDFPAGEEAFSIPATHGGIWLALRSEEPATKRLFADIRAYVSDD
jgi:hypothetical protein